MDIKPKVILFTLLVLLLSACQREGHLSVDSPWARPGTAGSNGAAYFAINNATSQPDLLLSANCDLAAATEIHMSRMREDGTMEMRPQENVPVPSGGSVTFEPGGLHVMLVDLQQDLQPGDAFDLQLAFQNAGEISVQVEVLEN
jgi:periplasmic copper chaperone A